MRGRNSVLALAAATALSPAFVEPTKASRIQSPKRRAVIPTSLRFMEQLGPGGYASPELYKHGLGRDGCRRLPSNASPALRAEAHQEKMATKRAIRRAQR